ncbi:MAG: hypothetical protein H0W99_04065 [Acidobacteria bacterium]|nr:hypothetical protein [Acidobacteriota bacterium]
MKRQLIYPVCALLLFCISSIAPSQSGVQKAGSTKVSKKSDRQATKRPTPKLMLRDGTVIFVPFRIGRFGYFDQFP